MANIDVSFLLSDPDFCDNITLVKRGIGQDEYGDEIVVDLSSQEIYASVQGAGKQDLTRLPEGSRPDDYIILHYSGELTAVEPYPDVLVWKGSRYQVKSVNSDFMNFGKGYVIALARLMP